MQPQTRLAPALEPIPAAERRLRGAAATLQAATRAARRELLDTGAIDSETWSLTELLADELEQRLDELEREHRLAGRC